LSGRVFVVCGIVIGISALVMSFGMPAVGGFNQAATTTLFASFFLFALCKAFWHIQRREIVLHREWMIRAFSVGLLEPRMNYESHDEDNPLHLPDISVHRIRKQFDTFPGGRHRKPPISLDALEC
jgi:hypothetical protein